MEQFESSAKRIEWLDICRGLLIILMVVGHSTGLFNKYIYQFHMAAFFFLSGYISHLEKRGIFDTIYHKFFTVLMPTIITVLLGYVALWLLHLCHLDKIVSSWGFIGWKHALAALFLRGDIWVDVLGANWFLITLFGVCILSKLIYQLVRKSPALYLIISIVLYVTGYVVVKTGEIPHIGMFSVDLVLIGNLFYALGYCFQQTNILEQLAKAKIIWSFIILVISAICMWLIKYYMHIIIDWPSRTFKYPILDGLAAINGTLFVFTISLIISRLLNRIGKLLCYIGKNTLGILFFHFIFFKVMYLPFYWLGIIAETDLSCITPGKMSTLVLEKRFWPIIAIGSLAFSLAMWRLLLRNKILSFLLGQDKQTYMKIWNMQGALRVRTFIQAIMTRCKDWFHSFFGWREKNKPLIYSIFLLFCLLSSLIIRQGITLNDDLNSSLVRQDGFIPLLIYEFKNELRMGRPMRLLGGFNYSLAFLTTNVTFNRFIQCIFLGICLIQFARMIRNLFKNDIIPIVTVVLIIACMPLTFEHSAPNAFIALVILPLWHLCISLNNWIYYLRTGKKKYFWWYLIAWIVALQGYEFVVTYTPIFLLIYIYERKLKLNTLKEAVYKCFPPVACGVIYIIATIAFGKLVSSQYSGTVLTFISVSSSLAIIKTLALSAIPGYFLFNAKYFYLFYLYSGEYIRNVYNAISSKNIGLVISDSNYRDKIWGLIGHIWLTPSNILRIVVLIVVVYYLRKFARATLCEQTSRTKFSLGVFLSILGYILIPSIPNSLSALYQGNVNATSFTSLPVSMFLFFSTCLLLSYIVYIIWTKWHKTMLVCCIFICILGLYVQTMNIVFANKSEENYARINMITNLFQSNCMRNLDGATIYAADLFETRDTLAISDHYWGQIAANNQISLEFTDDINAAVKIFYINDEYFCVVTETEIAVLSPKALNNIFLVATDTDNYVAVKSDTWQYDEEFFCYRFENSKDGLTALDNITPAFYDYQPDVGDTMDSAQIDGMYDDGWCGPHVRIRINSGEDGQLHIWGLYPKEIDPDVDYAISVYYEEKLVQTYLLQEQIIDITVSMPSDTVGTVDLFSNYVIESELGDMRDLCFIITDMY